MTLSNVQLLQQLMQHPHGCAFCDAGGKLRNPDKPHEADCLWGIAEQRVKRMADDWGSIGGDKYLSIPKVVDYVVAQSRSVLGLQAEVTGYLREGYEPCGGISVVVLTVATPGAVPQETWVYSQAMTLTSLVD